MSYLNFTNQSVDLELGHFRHMDEDELLIRKLSVYATVRHEDLRRETNKGFQSNRSLADLLRGWTRDQNDHDIPEEKAETGPAQLELRDHELNVKGLELDRRIAPGFRYHVRYLGTNEYMFDGEARRLESIGLGYGRRLTFQGDKLNFNDCYFWTDSNPNGVGFTIEAVREGDSFVVVDADGQTVATVAIHKVEFPQTELGTKIEDSTVVKSVKVRFACSIKHNKHHKHTLINVNTQDFEVVEGVAQLAKSRGQKEASVLCINDVRFKSLGRCTLLKDN